MLIGHQKQWQFLTQSAKLNRLSHAYLFSGPEKVGKKKLAFQWASFLLEENLEQKINPDLILVEPIDKEIQISQIRDLIWKLSLKPYSAPLKVAIIDQAHSMNPESQNCFLKTLEEPKEKTILILITEYPETLLPTIVSRCQTIKFYPVPQKEIENYLKEKGLEPERIQEILKISLGKPGLAIDFLLTPQKLRERKEITKEIISISKSDLVTKFQYVKEISQKDNPKEVLDIWLSFFRENLLSVLNSQPSALSHYPLTKIKNILSKIQTTNFLISTTNINSRLALEILMIEF